MDRADVMHSLELDGPGHNAPMLTNPSMVSSCGFESLSAVYFASSCCTAFHKVCSSRVVAVLPLGLRTSNCDPIRVAERQLLMPAAGMRFIQDNRGNLRAVALNLQEPQLD
jgi:hypothetical protein